MGAFFRAGPEKTGLSAPIPQKAFGFSAGFPLLSLAQKTKGIAASLLRENTKISILPIRT
jgi:hypothetical protein